jgi:hypothetical protein
VLAACIDHIEDQNILMEMYPKIDSYTDYLSKAILEKLDSKNTADMLLKTAERTITYWFDRDFRVGYHLLSGLKKEDLQRVFEKASLPILKKRAEDMLKERQLKGI